jgi:hypothetical protein
MKNISDEGKHKWIKTIRRESGLIEHICEHGVGHPAIGSVHWMELNGFASMGAHGCDGCCRDPEWIKDDLMEGMFRANELLLYTIGRNTLLRNMMKSRQEMESE